MNLDEDEWMHSSERIDKVEVCASASVSVLRCHRHYFQYKYSKEACPLESGLSIFVPNLEAHKASLDFSSVSSVMSV